MPEGASLGGDAPPTDLYVPSAKGSLMRAVLLQSIGKFRISRRDAEIYSVQIVNAGAWASLVVADGSGRELFIQPSTFTGSFWLGAGALGGIIAYLRSKTMAPSIVINFRERDQKLV